MGPKETPVPLEAGKEEKARRSDTMSLNTNVPDGGLSLLGHKKVDVKSLVGKVLLRGNWEGFASPRAAMRSRFFLDPLETR
jgi:hypothetical protein